MLTLTKRQHSVGFSAMNADELFFINGGSGSGYNCYMGGGSYSSSPSTRTITIPSNTKSSTTSTFTVEGNVQIFGPIKGSATFGGKVSKTTTTTISN